MLTGARAGIVPQAGENNQHSFGGAGATGPSHFGPARLRKRMEGNQLDQ